jgi:hypothetical protein
MSDAMLGTLVLASPIPIVLLIIGPTRRAIFTFVRLLVRFVGILLAVIGILLIGGEIRKLLLASIYDHANEELNGTPGRHAANIDTVTHSYGIDDAARYEGMYERQENSWVSP